MSFAAMAYLTEGLCLYALLTLYAEILFVLRAHERILRS
jgi:hypothetical protein